MLPAAASSYCGVPMPHDSNACSVPRKPMYFSRMAHFACVRMQPPAFCSAHFVPHILHMISLAAALAVDAHRLMKRLKGPVLQDGSLELKQLVKRNCLK